MLLKVFLAIVFFIPTIKTNHLIRDEFHNITRNIPVNNFCFKLA
jgi:hypothetical protein